VEPIQWLPGRLLLKNDDNNAVYNYVTRAHVDFLVQGVSRTQKKIELSAQSKEK
jgi:hypothetical protein